jgi:hypothetical protein
MGKPVEVTVTLSVEESAAAVLALRGDPLSSTYQRHFESAAEKIARAAKAAQMGPLYGATGPSISSVARAACGELA